MTRDSIVRTSPSALRETRATWFELSHYKVSLMLPRGRPGCQPHSCSVLRILAALPNTSTSLSRPQQNLKSISHCRQTRSRLTVDSRDSPRRGVTTKHSFAKRVEDDTALGHGFHELRFGLARGSQRMRDLKDREQKMSDGFSLRGLPQRANIRSRSRGTATQCIRAEPEHSTAGPEH
ncbi:hypothetical protein JZ751_020793 [Albula glossodonta]|uniref:Uncharacterized protein n=1 Tax=Albula glossodonta TaxID=121402 RepID=A0A8T2PJJ3_9TELE|nr:hypothetical protein JZ751_020793 [Albula glossodonta]